MLHTLRSTLQNAVYFIMLPFLVTVLFTFYIQQVSGRRPLTSWDRGFESHRGHGYLSVVSVVCCQVEVSATS